MDHKDLCDLQKLTALELVLLNALGMKVKAQILRHDFGMVFPLKAKFHFQSMYKKW